MSSKDDPDLQYGGRRFERASELLRRARTDEAGKRRYQRLLTDPQSVAALTRMIVALPRLQVVLTERAAGRTLRTHLSERRFGIPVNRIAQGVLELPEEAAAYLSGRHRQALRTNLRRASEQGITCLALPDGAERELLSGRWLDCRFPSRDSPFTLHELMRPPHPGASRWVAVDGDRVPVALGVMSVDHEWAMVHTHFSSTYEGGWVLHARLVADAIDGGVRYICATDGNALLLSPGIQYFQRLLGYRVVNLTLA